MSKHVAIGNQLAFFGFVDSLGFLTGSATSAPANGVVSDMIRLTGIQQATPGLPEGTDVSVQGDDDVIATMSFQPDSTPAFVANSGVEDMATQALLQSTLTEDDAGYTYGVLQPEDPAFNNGCAILQSRSISQDEADQGLEIWSGMIFPLIVAQPLGRESFNYREAGVFRTKFTAQKASHRPTGVTISDAVLCTTGASIINFRGYHPLRMVRITGDGAETTFTLPKAVANTGRIAAFVATQKLTHGAGITAVADSTSLVFASAPAAGAKVIVVYGFVP